jgi:hypothetical protein
MKKLFLILLFSFFSTQSIAEVGDTYYCIMNQHIKLTETGVEELELKRFKLKSEKTGSGVWKNIALHFKWDWGVEGKTGEAYSILFLEYDNEYIDYKNVERYSGSSGGETVHYEDGAFYFTIIGKEHISAIMAMCEPF